MFVVPGKNISKDYLRKYHLNIDTSTKIVLRTGVRAYKVAMTEKFLVLFQLKLELTMLL